MLTHKILYRKIGAFKITHFLHPRPIYAEDFLFPLDSMFFRFKLKDNINYISKDNRYFTNTDKGLVKVVTTLPEDALAGKYKWKPGISTIKVTQNFKKNEPRFKYVKPNASNLRLQAKVPLIFDFGSIIANYRYQPNPMNHYYRWANAFKALTNMLTPDKTGVNRHKYVLIDLPKLLHPYPVYKKALKRLNRQILEDFPTYEDLTVLEFLRFLSTDHNSDSFLASIPKTEWYNISFMFHTENTITLVNMAELAGLIKDYNMGVKHASYSPKIAHKLLLVFFSRILVSNGHTIEEADELTDTLPNIATDIEKSLSVDVLEDMEDDITIDANTLNYHKEVKAFKPVEDKAADVTITDDVELTNTIDNEYRSLEATTILSGTDTKTTGKDKLLSDIDKLKEFKIISKTVHTNLKTTLEEQEHKKIQYNNQSINLKDVLAGKLAISALDDKETTLPDNKVVLDKTQNKATVDAYTKKYLKDTYSKDILASLYSVQNAGYVVTEHDIDTETNILNDIEQHTLRITALDGTKQTVNIKLPIISKDGSFKLNGNRYRMRLQRSTLPIVKMEYNRVALTSYYGKLFVDKAKYSRSNLGYWFNKQLRAIADEDKKLHNIVSMSAIYPDIKTPKLYSIIARYTSEFVYGSYKFNFDYINRNRSVKDPTAYEKDNQVVVGTYKGKPLVMNFEDRLFVYDNGKYIEQPSIGELLGIDLSNGPGEYTTVKIFKENIPVGVLLAYYYGFNKLLKELKVNYTQHDTSKRVAVTNDEYVIRFSDVKYIIKKEHNYKDLILQGITTLDKHTKLLTSTTLDTKDNYAAMFTLLKLPVLYVNEIKLLESMFVDPITKNILELREEPTIFTDILVYANKLLETDSYKDSNDLLGMNIKTYDRVAGMLYKTLASSIRINASKKHFGKSKLEVNPYTVIAMINNDSTTVLEDNLNPIAELKQREDSTYLGFGGRMEEALVGETRKYNLSSFGVVSEAVKDSGAVGISAYLTPAAKITNTRGFIGSYDKDKDGWSSIISTSSNLAPFSTNDDGKRMNFISIMNGHVIPIANTEAPYVRTGYEAVVPLRSSDVFVSTAVSGGVVKSVTKDYVTVSYTKEKTTEKYNLKSWTSKEEAGGTYTNHMVTNLKKGDKVAIGDTIVYNKAFFEPDIFNPKRVILKLGTYVNVAVKDETATYEDGAAMHTRVGKILKTTTTKIKSFIVKNTDEIVDMLDVGTKVSTSTVMFTKVDGSIIGDKELDKKTIELFKNLSTVSPKAKYNGVISKIVVYYKNDIKDLSRSLRKLAKASDEELIVNTGYTGLIDNTYSYNGVPLGEDEAHIKVYIDVVDTMGMGDKAILSNQLKFTIGEVFSNDITTATGEKIDILFSGASISARIVNSHALHGTTAVLLDKIADKAVEAYFG